MEEQSTVNLQKKEKAPYNNMTKNLTTLMGKIYLMFNQPKIFMRH